MYVYVLISIIGLTVGQQLPHGHDLKTLVDNAFRRLDHNPADGVVTENEFDALITHDDVDKNGCVSYQEYVNAHIRQSQEVADKMFHHFENDGDNCLNVQDMQEEFHLIDHNGDNQLDMHEFEKYYTHLLGILFGHGHNGK